VIEFKYARQKKINFLIDFFFKLYYIIDNRSIDNRGCTGFRRGMKGTEQHVEDIGWPR